jgi:hypothetical protein
MKKANLILLAAAFSLLAVSPPALAKKYATPDDRDAVKDAIKVIKEEIKDLRKQNPHDPTIDDLKQQIKDIRASGHV